MGNGARSRGELLHPGGSFPPLSFRWRGLPAFGEPQGGARQVNFFTWTRGSDRRTRRMWDRTQGASLWTRGSASSNRELRSVTRGSGCWTRESRSWTRRSRSWTRGSADSTGELTLVTRGSESWTRELRRWTHGSDSATRGSSSVTHGSSSVTRGSRDAWSPGDRAVGGSMTPLPGSISRIRDFLGVRTFGCLRARGSRRPRTPVRRWPDGWKDWQDGERTSRPDLAIRSGWILRVTAS
jgi:hypothetical protein